MSRFVTVVTTIFLLAGEVVTSSTNRCSPSGKSAICLQQCNASSCKCGGTDEKLDYKACNQTCLAPDCKTITCSSGTCHQKCHNCHMECTDDVGYCEQQCLSGACSFKCNAKRCVQACGGKRCSHQASGQAQPVLNRTYLAVLAGLFAATTILTCLALTLTCSKTKCFRRGPRLRTRFFSGSVESINSRSSIL